MLVTSDQVYTMNNNQPIRDFFPGNNGIKYYVDPQTGFITSAGRYQDPAMLLALDQQERANAAIVKLEQMDFWLLTKELLTQISENIPGAVQLSASCLGVPIWKFLDLVKGKQILLTDFIPRFKSAIANQFLPNHDELIEAFWLAVSEPLSHFIEKPRQFFDNAGVD